MPDRTYTEHAPHYQPPPPEGSCQAWVDSTGVQLACRGDRITAALADLDQVGRHAVPQTHWVGCWSTPWHGECLAARIRATLTGEDHDR